MTDAPPDVRRRIPGTGAVLADPALAEPIGRLGRGLVKRVVHETQAAARRGKVSPDGVVEAVLAGLPGSATSLRPVLNATGVLLHTNLGRAPLSAAARDALLIAAGTCDVELDLATGERGRRGAGAVSALLAAVPGAAEAHVVNNGAAALALITATLAAGREVVVSRGELVEIGDGFRLPDLLVAAGARLREVGTTNRTHVADYAEAVGPDTGFVLKVHPSNFVVTGFTGAVGPGPLAGLGVPVVVDIGSGLLGPHPRLPAEPDAAGALAAGASVVTASGDKLLGGPQAGLLLGSAGAGAEAVRRARRHPLARAMRVDKLTLAALEATVRGPDTPTRLALDADPAALRRRAAALADALREEGVAAGVADTAAAVGGGGAPGLSLPSAAITLPESLAAPLRAGCPAVLGRVERGRCLLDLRALAAEDDPALRDAVLRAHRAG